MEQEQTARAEELARVKEALRLHELRRSTATSRASSIHSDSSSVLRGQISGLTSTIDKQALELAEFRAAAEGLHAQKMESESRRIQEACQSKLDEAIRAIQESAREEVNAERLRHEQQEREMAESLNEAKCEQEEDKIATYQEQPWQEEAGTPSPMASR